MASIFGHVALSTTLGKSFFHKSAKTGLLLLAGFCAFAPDLDVIGFQFGIPYASPWGHRGWTHSIAFALLFGSLMGALYVWRQREKESPPAFIPTALLLILSTLSHPLVDMLTNGGLGIALFFPFDDTRMFFPVRPIQVSPLSVGGFLHKWGWEVLKSEFVWIGLPGLFVYWTMRVVRRLKNPS